LIGLPVVPSIWFWKAFAMAPRVKLLLGGLSIPS